MLRLRGAIGVSVMATVSAALLGLWSKPDTVAFVSNPPLLPPQEVARASPISSGEILREINRLRENPAAYADWLETVRQYYDGTTLAWPGETPIETKEGVAALDDAISALRRSTARITLELSSGMTNSASDHVQNLLQQNRFSLRGIDGSTPEDRVKQYGVYEGSFEELLTQGVTNPAAIVAGLVIDDGNPSRSYRQTLLRGAFRHAGIHCEPAGDFAMCITNFAASYTESEAVEPAPSLTHELSRKLAEDIIAETNRVRLDPVGYTSKLEAIRPYYQGRRLSIPGQPTIIMDGDVSALDEAIADIRSRSPVLTLDRSTGLSEGAADHAKDLGPRGGEGHIGSDGSEPKDRVRRYGTLPPGTLVGENISFGPPASAGWHVMQLLVSQSHRETMLEPEYRLTGAACAPHPEFRIVCVATYASAYDE